MLGRVRAAVAVVGLLVVAGALAGCHGARAARDVACEPPAPPCPPAPVADDRPPGAECGDVWCRVWVPPVTTTERHVDCKPTVCCERKVPPVWGECSELVCLCPPETCCVEIPAQYEWVTERVLVEPARVETRALPGCGIFGVFDPVCVQKPVAAKFETRCRKVCVRPQSWEHRSTCAVWGERKNRVLVRSGGWNQVPVTPPASYYDVCKEVSPARWEWRKNETCVPPAAPCPPQPCPPQPCPPAPCDPCGPPPPLGTGAPPVVRSSP